MSQHKDEFIDIVTENFVNAYVNEFNPKIVEWYSYGVPKVPEIGRLLAELYKENKIDIDITAKFGKTVIQSGFIFTLEDNKLTFFW